jgi:uncharacterized oxidoreductase
VIILGRRRGYLDEVDTANRSMAAIELDITDPVSIWSRPGQLTRDHPDLDVLFNNDGIMLPVEAAGRIGAKLLSTPSPPT